MWMRKINRISSAAMDIRIHIFLLILSTVLTLKAVSMKLEYERALILRYDWKYTNKPKMWVGHYNRTEKVLNGDFFFKRPLRDEAKLMIEFSRFTSNEYHSTGIRLGVRIKDFVSKNETVKGLFTSGTDLLKNVFEPPMLWPLKVNVTYRLRNLKCEEIYLPLFPEGLYQSKSSIYLDDEHTLILTMGIHFKISYPVVF